MGSSVMSEASKGTDAREVSLLMALACSGEASTPGENAGELGRRLAQGVDVGPEMLWQALWLAAGAHLVGRRYSAALGLLERLTGVSGELGVPALSARAYTALAECEHVLGEYSRAASSARRAYDLARELPGGNSEAVKALTVVVAAETEARRLPEAAAGAGQLLSLAAQAPPALSTRARRTAAIAYAQAGEAGKAVMVIESAMDGSDRRDDPVLWLRVRLTAASFYLQLDSPRLDQADSLLGAVMPLLRCIGSPRQAQEALLLEARLAVARGDYPRAQEAFTTLNEEEPFLNNVDLHWLSMVRGELMIAENRRHETRG